MDNVELCDALRITAAGNPAAVYIRFETLDRLSHLGLIQFDGQWKPTAAGRLLASSIEDGDLPNLVES
jgi:hypothetical protein